MKSVALSSKRILNLLKKLNLHLSKQNIRAEIYLVGGAVMCLALNARKSTMDLDGVFVPASRVREMAKKIAEEENIPTSWLNDGVKGFMSPSGEFLVFREWSHLKVFTARPEYLLAMKCLSMRIGEEFSDESDVRYLLRYLNVETVDQAVMIITQYYPEEKFPPKALYALQEILTAEK